MLSFIRVALVRMSLPCDRTVTKTAVFKIVGIVATGAITLSKTWQAEESPVGPVGIWFLAAILQLTWAQHHPLMARVRLWLGSHMSTNGQGRCLRCVFYCSELSSKPFLGLTFRMELFPKVRNRVEWTVIMIAVFTVPHICDMRVTHNGYIT